MYKFFIAAGLILIGMILGKVLPNLVYYIIFNKYEEINEKD